MKLLSTRFFAAMAASSASACASVAGGGRSIGRDRTMERGTTASISAWREAAPITESIRASSAASGPMWRAANSAAFSRSASGRAADMSMAGSAAGVRGS